VVNAILDIPALATLRDSSTSSTSVSVADKALRVMLTFGLLSSSSDKIPVFALASGI
jgi:hypothetical protein